MRIFLDDTREPPNDGEPWTLVRNYDEFVKACETAWALDEPIELISFDHDLAFNHYAGVFNEKEKTGFDCAKWLCESCIAYGHEIPEYYVHSMNVCGKANIHAIMVSANKIWPQAWAF